MLTNVNIDPRALLSEEIRPLRRQEFEQLARDGAFDDERVELLFGQIVVMSPPDPSHDAPIMVLTRELVRRLGDRAWVRPQLSFAASDDSEPVPDLVVCPPGSYWHEHPSRALLVIEVARTSLRKDRTVKAMLYGSVAVDEYWIVDVESGCVHVLRDPDGHGDWRTRRVAYRGDTLALLAFPDVVIDVASIVPPV
jgi:Uma2 family endonuclease